MTTADHAARQWGRWLGFTLLLAAGYYISGRLGLLLAIPPGYATAVFPPSGLALAALLLGGPRLAPGVWLGSFTMNLWITFAATPTATFGQAVPIAGTVAVGATLQALAGYWLIVHHVKLTAVDEPDPVRFLLLGGPVSCLISASAGIGTLVTIGAIPLADAPFNWFTWWVGDAIGVITIAPLVLILIGRGHYTWRRRRLTVALPLALTFAVAVLMFIRVSSWGNASIESEFTKQASDLGGRIGYQLERMNDTLYDIAGLYNSSETVTRQEFHDFVLRELARTPEIQALEWVPRVSAMQRSAFEAELRAAGLAPLGITERTSDNRLMPATARPEYFPIAYAEPLGHNRQVIGYDVGSEADRHRALSAARDSGQPTATAPIHLLQDKHPQLGLILFLPIYQAGVPTDDLSSRREALRGFAQIVFRVQDTLRSAMTPQHQQNLHVRVRDMNTPPDRQLLFDNHPELAAQSGPLAILTEQQIYFGGRHYRIRFRPTPHFLTTHRSWQAWLVLTAGLLFSAILGAFLLTLTGHTARVEAEVAERTEALRLAEQAARERESRLDSILSQAIDAILLCDEHGTIIRANAAATQLFDLPITTLQQQPLLELIQHADGSLLTDTIVGLYRQLNHGRTGEAWVRPAGQAPIPVEFSLSPVKLDHDLNYTVILRDVRERKRVERMKHELVATVSHELRTPLTAIRGSLGLLSGGALGELPPAVHELVILAQRNSERLVLLINDLLDLERLELGTLTLTVQPTQVDAIVAQAVAANRPYADQFGVQLVLDIPAPPPYVAQADPARLIQVLTNLIANAVKFSPEQGMVTVTLARADNHLRISVRDQGPGVPLEFQSRIFQPFAQADASDSRAGAGAGLGLSISKHLIERMGGSIGFTSPPGQGATFFVHLPAPPPALDAALNYTSSTGKNGAPPPEAPPAASGTPQ